MWNRFRSICYMNCALKLNKQTQVSFNGLYYVAIGIGMYATRHGLCSGTFMNTRQQRKRIHAYGLTYQIYTKTP